MILKNKPSQWPGLFILESKEIKIGGSRCTYFIFKFDNMLRIHGNRKITLTCIFFSSLSKFFSNELA